VDPRFLWEKVTPIFRVCFVVSLTSDIKEIIFSRRPVPRMEITLAFSRAIVTWW
jgi:hypothetical protein